MANFKFRETALEKFFRNIIQRGEVPRHIAFVLDGNRRYARERNLKTVGGHRKGSDTFEQTIQWAMLLGIQEVTAYVFSINNFNRTPEEVNGIMEILKEKLGNILQHPEEFNGRCYRFIGNRSLVPEDLKPVLSRLTLLTRKNTAIIINIAFAYTGRDEIASGVNTLLNGISHNELDVNCINEFIFEQAFHNFPVSSVDLFIRTGECRLSDFLTWETSDQTILCFRDEYWPEFSYWKFLSTIFLFQANKYFIPEQTVGNGNKLRNTTWKGNTQNLNKFVQKKIDNELRMMEKHAALMDKDVGVPECDGMFGCD
ncbi:unnamed protein product [Orchesella dallaii]|uniref:Alkyl transferase n=1 Tax=Orchesella dallaii TaxID=48710 RepID=A0ABP1RM19_9HEXA